jgi:hypothetical protein
VAGISFLSTLPAVQSNRSLTITPTTTTTSPPPPFPLHHHLHDTIIVTYHHQHYHRTTTTIVSTTIAAIIAIATPPPSSSIITTTITTTLSLSLPPLSPPQPPSPSPPPPDPLDAATGKISVECTGNGVPTFDAFRNAKEFLCGGILSRSAMPGGGIQELQVFKICIHRERIHLL